jgi:5-carboxymethyl-2-hydroxymuconate isomerase
MPHLSLEYSAGLEDRTDMKAFMAALHDAMLAAKIFPLAGIRIRAFRADHALVADRHPENDFCAMTLNVGAGRTQEDLKAAGDMIFAAAQTALAGPLATTHFALSLYIREIDPALSWKDTPIHARLSGQS